MACFGSKAALRDWLLLAYCVEKSTLLGLPCIEAIRENRSAPNAQSHAFGGAQNFNLRIGKLKRVAATHTMLQANQGYTTR